MYTIADSWDNIIPVCGNHKEEIPMVINQGPHSLFYSCPKYYPQNRDKDEKACNNRINLVEYQKMVDTLMGKIAEAQCSGGIADLTNYTWKSKGIHFKVIEHTRDKLKVEILNLKAMR